LPKRYQLAIHHASLDNRRMTAAVGADIESICTKCGDVWHVVVAKVGERIAKVQCKECHSFHRYKPPGGAVKARSASAPRARRAAATPPPPSVAPDLSRAVRRYGASEAYTSGDRIQHPSFGLGVVQGSPGPGKMDVAFPGGNRVLAQAKAAAMGLMRPPRVSDD
jgi:hypothetical protein